MKSLIVVTVLCIISCGGVSNPRSREAELEKENRELKARIATNNGKNQPYCSGVLTVSTDVQQNPDWINGKCTNPTLGNEPGEYEVNGWIAKVTDIAPNDPKSPTICAALVVPAQGVSSFTFPAAGKKVELAKADIDNEKPCELLKPTRPAVAK
jgi:hypothetical protein